MPALTWSPEFTLGIPAMDATHREFVDLLAAVDGAPDDALVARWATLIEHTSQHFASEDRYMQATHFPATSFHSGHHGMVLDTLRQGLARGRAGDLAPIRQLARELASWFVGHAESMDAALAAHMQHTGFDPATAPASANAQPAATGCGCGCACAARSLDATA